jgi:hypothetical protein
MRTGRLQIAHELVVDRSASDDHQYPIKGQGLRNGSMLLLGRETRSRSGVVSLGCSGDGAEKHPLNLNQVMLAEEVRDGKGGAFARYHLR